MTPLVLKLTPVHEYALVDDQESVLELPRTTAVGFAESDAVGGGIRPGLTHVTLHPYCPPTTAIPEQQRGSDSRTVIITGQEPIDKTSTTPPSGTQADAADTAVHGPQLLFSFDSVTLLLASAQARINHVPALGKVCDTDTLLLLPAAIDAVEMLPIVVAFAPPEEVALWKRVVDEPAKALPMFETVTEKLRTVPAVAVVGVIDPAVRLGRGCTVTVTLFEHCAVVDCPPDETVTDAVFVPAEV